MKKTRPHATALALWAVFLFVALSACKKDKQSTATGIIGTWAGTPAFQSSSHVNAYQFKSNGEVYYYQYLIDTVSKKVLGYYYRFQGSYKVDNSVLTMYNLQYFTNPGLTFGPLSALSQDTGPSIQSYTIGFNSQYSVLSLYFSCPAYADCVPSPLVFYRQ